MPLQNILADIAADQGIQISDEKNRTWLITKINRAAEEIYAHNDLKGCEREQLFEFARDQQQIALPNYIDKVFAARDYEMRIPMTQVDMRPRYTSREWLRPFLGYPYYKWRIKGKSALQQELADISPITVSVPLVNSRAFTVIITGSTPNSSRVQEVLTFTTADTSKSTSNIFSTIESVRKSSTTDYDVSFSDLDGNILAVLSNHELVSPYTIVQVLDRNEMPARSQLVEILFKVRFTPFVNDYDSFLCGDVYDQPIIWRALSNIYATRGDDGVQRAAAYLQRSEQMLISIANQKEDCEDKKLNFGENRTYAIMRSLGIQTVTMKPTWDILYNNRS